MSCATDKCRFKLAMWPLLRVLPVPVLPADVVRRMLSSDMARLCRGDAVRIAGPVAAAACCRNVEGFLAAAEDRYAHFRAVCRIVQLDWEAWYRMRVMMRRAQIGPCSFTCKHFSWSREPTTKKREKVQWRLGPARCTSYTAADRIVSARSSRCK